jgi:hypothetical protein
MLVISVRKCCRNVEHYLNQLNTSYLPAVATGEQNIPTEFRHGRRKQTYHSQEAYM